jgi:hypothetical protein
MNFKDVERLALRRLKDAASDNDIERSHGKADDALCEALIALGFSAVVERFRELPKWYA